MIAPRVLGWLAAAVALGVVLDLLTGASPAGYGAGIGAAGVVLLTLASSGLGRALRRDAELYDHLDTPAPRSGQGRADQHRSDEGRSDVDQGVDHPGGGRRRG